MAPRYGRGSRLWRPPRTVRACPRLHISFCVSSWWPLSQPRAGSFPSTPVRLHVTAVEREPPLHDPGSRHRGRPRLDDLLPLAHRPTASYTRGRTHTVSRPCAAREWPVWARPDGRAMTTSHHITRTGLGRIAAALAALALALAASPIAANATHDAGRTAAGAECCGP